MTLLQLPALWYWPFAILALSVTTIVVLITVLRVHPFFALIAAAIIAGLLAAELPGGTDMPHWIRALQLPLVEFGRTAWNISIVIALASVIGVCLMESGAAESIVRRLLSFLGEKRAGTALLSSGFFLGIPVFFDTVFFLLVPLARALSQRTGRLFLFYVMAICGGAVITHSLVAPTPGPLIMADTLQIDLGFTILAGILAGLLPAGLVLVIGRMLDRRLKLPSPAAPGSEAGSLTEKSTSELPSFGLSLLPVLVPVLLIAGASFYGLAETYSPSLGTERFAALKSAVLFAGNRNLAMLVGTLIALGILLRQNPGTRLGRLLADPLKTAVIIIIITSAGGAFGAMIRHAGVGDAIKTVIEGKEMNLILLAWIISTALKIAQGSGTVAMITTSAMMVAIFEGMPALPYHSIYIFLAIGFGSMTISWMNDSAFWVVGKLSGFTVRETLRSWTLLLACISIFGLIQLLVCASIFPLTPR